jgi:AbrB family looped-hinge helix DNA binding protein
MFTSSKTFCSSGLDGLDESTSSSLAGLGVAFSGKPENQANGIIRQEGVMQSARVGKRGAIIVPANLRRRFGIEEGTIVTAEEKDDGILIRPAVVIPVERYTPERKAEFLLSNAVDEADYRSARKAVRKMGLNPDSIPHARPS